MKQFLTALLILCICHASFAQVKFNGDIELLNHNKTKPSGWSTYFTYEQLQAYPVKVDSIVKQHGKYALSMQKVNDKSDFGVIDFPIIKTFKGDKIELRGYIKTENINTGFAGLWLRIDGADNVIAFDNMRDRGVKRTTDWKEYVIDLAYDSAKAISIHAGALLVGDGKMWVDNFHLFINGQSIEQAPLINKTLAVAITDTTFISGSRIDTVVLNRQRLINLVALGQVWGFLKYHHPTVAKGNYNWDAELFRIMPAVLKSPNNQMLSNVLEKWIDSLGVPPVCRDCNLKENEADIKLKPNYGMLFTGKVFSVSLSKKLSYILANRNTQPGYYITMAANGNPSFLHETPYSGFAYPDAGYRILCLYRYWNMINYFFPYRYLIGEDWNNVLADCIPKFILSANATDYTLNTLAMIARVHDTHANIWRENSALADYRGKYAMPFQAKFIEDKLVVTGYYNDTLNVKQLVKPGDIIDNINHVPVTELVNKYLPYTPASNYARQLRDMPKEYLLRANNPIFALDIERDGMMQKKNVTGLPLKKINYTADYNPNPKAPGFYLMDNNIGYLYPGKYHDKDIPAIKKLFDKTLGIIIDMRCYPSEFMPYTFIPYIKANNSGFAKFSKGSVYCPGLFMIKDSTKTPSDKEYKGKVVVIVNSESLSQAEFTTMAFQSSPNVTVIGSTTAGADGDVSPIALPGGITTLISGLGIYYPDGTDTQRKGVKIDEQVNPTIAGVKAGRDELLERAKVIILGK